MYILVINHTIFDEEPAGEDYERGYRSGPIYRGTEFKVYNREQRAHESLLDILGTKPDLVFTREADLLKHLEKWKQENPKGKCVRRSYDPSFDPTDDDEDFDFEPPDWQ